MRDVIQWSAFADELGKEASAMGHSLHTLLHTDWRNQEKQMNPRDVLDRRTIRRFRKPNPRFIKSMTSNTKFSK